MPVHVHLDRDALAAADLKVDGAATAEDELDHKLLAVQFARHHLRSGSSSWTDRLGSVLADADLRFGTVPFANESGDLVELPQFAEAATLSAVAHDLEAVSLQLRNGVQILGVAVFRSIIGSSAFEWLHA